MNHVSELLQWCPDNIHKPRGPLKQIPSEFPSIQDYKKAYLMPVLDEMRENVNSAFGDALEAEQGKFSPSIPWEVFKVKAFMSINGKTGRLTMKVGMPPTAFRNFISGDLVIITKENQKLIHGNFALIQRWIRVSSNKNKPLKPGQYVYQFYDFKVKENSILSDIDGDYRVTLVTNLIGFQRIFEAIDAPLGTSAQHLLSVAADPKRTISASSKLPSKKESFNAFIQELKKLMGESRFLNPSQAKAVYQCVRSEGINLIRGPPGTGKTSTIVGMIVWAVHQNQTVIVCAPTNAAIAEVGSRVNRYLIQFKKVSPFKTNDVLVVADETRMKNVDELQDLSLETKVKRLRAVVEGNIDVLMLQLVDFPAMVAHWFKMYTTNKDAKALDQSLKHELNHFSRPFDFMSKDVVKKYPGATLLQFIKLCLQKLSSYADSMIQVFEEDLPLMTKFASEHKMVVSSAKQLSVLCQQFCKSKAFNIDHEVSSNLAKTIYNVFELREGIQPSLRDPLQNIKQKMDQLRSAFAELKCNRFRGHQKWFEYRWCQEFVKGAKVILSTISVTGRKLFGDLKDAFDMTCIVDEASQATEADTLIPLRLPIRRMILVGDDKQLPSTILSRPAEKAGLGRSLFDRLVHFNFPVNLLNEQYRMKPEISYFPNHQFYDGLINDHHSVVGKQYVKDWHMHSVFAPSVFIDVPGSVEYVDDSCSKFNPLEAVVVAGLVVEFQAHVKCLNSKASKKVTMGIISGYRAQVTEIIKVLSGHSFKATDQEANVLDGEHLTIDVNTVDSFQGQERDVIIVSSARSNSKGTIGFMSDQRRLNVAITRAKFTLWIVGCAKTLKTDGLWQKYLQNMKPIDASKHPLLSPHYLKKEGHVGQVSQGPKKQVEANKKKSKPEKKPKKGPNMTRAEKKKKNKRDKKKNKKEKKKALAEAKKAQSQSDVVSKKNTQAMVDGIGKLLDKLSLDI